MSRISDAEAAVEMAQQEVKAAQSELDNAKARLARALNELSVARVEEDADLPRVTVFESVHCVESQHSVKYVIIKRTPKSIKVRPVGRPDRKPTEFRPGRSAYGDPASHWYLYPRQKSRLYGYSYVKLGDDGNFVHVGG